MMGVKVQRFIIDGMGYNGASANNFSGGATATYGIG